MSSITIRLSLQGGGIADTTLRAPTAIFQKDTFTYIFQIHKEIEIGHLRITFPICKLTPYRFLFCLCREDGSRTLHVVLLQPGGVDLAQVQRHEGALLSWRSALVIWHFLRWCNPCSVCNASGKVLPKIASNLNLLYCLFFVRATEGLQVDARLTSPLFL